MFSLDTEWQTYLGEDLEFNIVVFVLIDFTTWDFTHLSLKMNLTKPITYLVD